MNMKIIMESLRNSLENLSTQNPTILKNKAGVNMIYDEIREAMNDVSYFFLLFSLSPLEITQLIKRC